MHVLPAEPAWSLPKVVQWVVCYGTTGERGKAASRVVGGFAHWLAARPSAAREKVGWQYGQVWEEQGWKGGEQGSFWVGREEKGGRGGFSSTSMWPTLIPLPYSCLQQEHALIRGMNLYLTSGTWAPGIDWRCIRTLFEAYSHGLYKL